MTHHQPVLPIYSHDLLAAEKPSALALKDAAAIRIMMDTLSRKEQHHIALTGCESEKIFSALMESLSLHLVEDRIPRALRNIDFIYLDCKRLASHSEIHAAIIAELTALQADGKRIILALNQFDAQDVLGQWIMANLTDDCWRFITIATHSFSDAFTLVQFAEPNLQQLTALLKTYKDSLESYHHVLIVEEAFAAALSMASHYLTNHLRFDKALQLLDSAAARASTIEHHEHSSHSKPIVTAATLEDVISDWTHIPLSHLSNNRFHSSKLIEALQRQIHGQDAAIGSIASTLQHAYLKLKPTTGPLCGFLFAGPAETGKSATALALAEHLFGHRKALLRVNLNEACDTLAYVKIINEEYECKYLLAAIKQAPYAIVLFENIHQVSAATLDLFKTIFLHGYALDDQNQQYDFQHAIIVMTTTIGGEKIAASTQTTPVYEANKTLDLIQLVLNEHPQETSNQTATQISMSELCDEIMPLLESYFPSILLQQFHVVPFIPLDFAALEKIVRAKVKLIAKLLETNFGLELNYAPEIIKFLAHEALWRKHPSKTLEKLLEHHLYTAIGNEILAHADDKNRPKRLSLQLNEDGQLLRCEFVSATGAAIY